jgi:hypothetical protein
MPTGRDDDRHQSDLLQTLDRSHPLLAATTTTLSNVNTPAGLTLGWAHDNLDFNQDLHLTSPSRDSGTLCAELSSTLSVSAARPAVGRRSDRQEYLQSALAPPGHTCE